jgi:hypothetical protein
MQYNCCVLLNFMLLYIFINKNVYILKQVRNFKFRGTPLVSSPVGARETTTLNKISVKQDETVACFLFSLFFCCTLLAR